MVEVMQAHVVVNEAGDTRLSAIISYGVTSNVYILEKRRKTIIIDTGYGSPYSDIERSLERFNIEMREIDDILLTHRHKDHTNGLKKILKNNEKTQIYIHKADAEIVCKRLKIDKRRIHLIRENEEIEIGKILIKAICTPGHTAGSICYLMDDKLFSGDLVFANGHYGRTDLPSGNIEELIKSLEKIYRLDINKLFSGHGEILLRNVKIHIRAAINNAKKKMKNKGYNRQINHN